MADVLAFAEQREGQLGSAAREAVGVAAGIAESLGGTAHALVLGAPGLVILERLLETVFRQLGVALLQLCQGLVDERFLFRLAASMSFCCTSPGPRKPVLVNLLLYWAVSQYSSKDACIHSAVNGSSPRATL